MVVSLSRSVVDRRFLGVCSPNPAIKKQKQKIETNKTVQEKENRKKSLWLINGKDFLFAFPWRELQPVVGIDKFF